MSTEKLSTLSFRKQWRVLLEYRSDISLSYSKSWVSILDGDNLLCVEEGNIYPIQRTSNHFNSTCTTQYICIQTMLYVIFCFKMAYNLKSVPTQDKFLDFLQRQFFRFEIIYSTMLHITGMNWSFTDFFYPAKVFYNSEQTFNKTCGTWKYYCILLFTTRNYNHIVYAGVLSTTILMKKIINFLYSHLVAVYETFMYNQMLHKICSFLTSTFLMYPFAFTLHTGNIHFCP